MSVGMFVECTDEVSDDTKNATQQNDTRLTAPIPPYLSYECTAWKRKLTIPVAAPIKKAAWFPLSTVRSFSVDVVASAIVQWVSRDGARALTGRVAAWPSRDPAETEFAHSHAQHGTDSTFARLTRHEVGSTKEVYRCR
ncbi:MAG: hypothetical protein NVS4B6_02690 [Mycobacterium sp.]